MAQLTRSLKFSRTLAAGLLLTGIASCARYSEVTEVQPRFHPIAATASAVVSAGQQIGAGLLHEHHNSLAALGCFLDAAQAAALRLKQSPGDQAAIDDYNFAVARIFTAIHDGNMDPWTHPLAVPGPSGEHVLTYRPDPLKRKAYNAELYDFVPADQFDIKGSYVSTRTIKPGLGAPLVAIGKAVREDAAEEFALEHTFYGVTAVVRFNGRMAIIDFEDPLSTETVSLDSHTYPLAADFTVPVAVMLTREDPKKLEITRLLNPEKYAKTAHIVRLQPYDPNKTVVIVVHGLMDSPATWTPMINTLRGDPVIRKNFQFWFYSYPSGYPYPYSATIMRHDLDAIERRFPLKRKIVLIGHSMGGMICRLMITDSGNKLWLSFFGKPPEETSLSPKTRATIEDSLIFRHRAEVGRVIFISTPHRGSNLATNWVGRIGGALVRTPLMLATINLEIRKAVVADTGFLRLNRMPNSIDTLAPNNRFVKAVNTVPITPGIPYHTIAGDRGRGDAPHSSDGVVPYWSSHLDGAQSELMVPSHHSAHQNPKAIAEVDRILRLHASLSQSN